MEGKTTLITTILSSILGMFLDVCREKEFWQRKLDLKSSGEAVDERKCWVNPSGARLPFSCPLISLLCDAEIASVSFWLHPEDCKCSVPKCQPELTGSRRCSSFSQQR